MIKYSSIVGEIMEKKYILHKENCDTSVVLYDLCNYIIKHQSDYNEDERTYEFMRTISCATQYLDNFEEKNRIIKMLYSIDSYSYSCIEKYKIMMQLLNLFLFNKSILKLEDDTILYWSEQLKDIKAMDVNEILKRSLDPKDIFELVRVR